MFILGDDPVFPPPEESDEDGLLAIGGDLSITRLLNAYRNGIFPWFSGNVPMWYSPDPRFVLDPEDLVVSRSMRTLLRRKAFDVTVNKAFAEVISNCSSVPREGQSGTWITTDMREAYIELHRLGHAVSVEAWKEGRLVGGMYGIRMDPFFFGESMFTLEANASKYAFIEYVQRAREEGVILFDCQVHSAHLESLGAIHLPRSLFLLILRGHLGA